MRAKLLIFSQIGLALFSAAAFSQNASPGVRPIVVSRQGLKSMTVGSRNLCDTTVQSKNPAKNGTLLCAFPEPTLSVLAGKITEVATGDDLTCLSDEDGVKCWGNDIMSTTELSALAAAPGVGHLFAGGRAICRVKAGGIVVCRHPEIGALSLGPSTDLRGASMGANHLCALDGDHLSCLSLFTSRALGLPTEPLASAREVAVGTDHVCVLDDTGLSCFNTDGEIQGLPKAQFIGAKSLAAAAYHQCAITSGDGVACAQTGAGSPSKAVTEIPPELARDGAGVIQLAVGTSFNCVLVKDASSPFGSSVRCWGEDYYGALRPPAFSSRVVQLAGGAAHFCALLASGELSCWGDGSSGATIPPLRRGSDLHVAVAEDATCAWNSSGAYCKGLYSVEGGIPRFHELQSFVVSHSGAFASCGVDHSAQGATEVKCAGTDLDQVPPGLTNPSVLAIGNGAACAVQDDSLVCWGSHSFANPPSKVRAVEKIEIGMDHACLKDRFGLYCWGDLAQDTNPMPSEVSSPDWALDFTVGARHSCALTADKRVLCWGSNVYGQTDVPPLNAPYAIGAAGDFTCASDLDGVTCWGAVPTDWAQAFRYKKHPQKALIYHGKSGT